MTVAGNSDGNRLPRYAAPERCRCSAGLAQPLTAWASSPSSWRSPGGTGAVSSTRPNLRQGATMVIGGGSGESFPVPRRKAVKVLGTGWLSLSSTDLSGLGSPSTHRSSFHSRQRSGQAPSEILIRGGEVVNADGAERADVRIGHDSPSAPHSRPPLPRGFRLQRATPTRGDPATILLYGVPPAGGCEGPGKPIRGRNFARISLGRRHPGPSSRMAITCTKRPSS